MNVEFYQLFLAPIQMIVAVIFFLTMYLTLILCMLNHPFDPDESKLVLAYDSFYVLLDFGCHITLLRICTIRIHQ